MSSSPSDMKTFTCAEYGNDLKDAYKIFYKKEQMLDITLTAVDDNTSFGAHRTYLSALSEYFRQIFTSNDSETVEIQLSNMNGSTLKSILDFMYTGSIELHSKTVKRILLAADLLKIDILTAACLDFIREQLNTSNCLMYAYFAEQHDQTALKTKCFTFAYQHFEEVCTEKTFLLLNEEQLNDFLSGEDLQVSSQEILFDSLVAWYKRDEVNREEHISSLLAQHVRFAMLEPKFIVDNRQKLCQVSKCSELLWNWLEWHMSMGSPKRKTQNIVFAYRTANERMLGVQSFNPELNKWSYENWPSLPNNRTDYAILFVSGKLIISGGKFNGRLTNSVEYLDLRSKEWSHLPRMLAPRMNHIMVESNGIMYVLGGRSDSSRLTSVEKYNSSEGNWQYVSPIETTSRCTAVTLNSLLYVSRCNMYNLACYDPRINNWTMTAPRKEKISQCGLAVVKGCIYAFGGNNNSTTVEQYNPENNTWTVVQSLQVGRAWTVGTAWNDRLIVCGGEKDNQNIAYLFEQYDPQTNAWKSLPSFLTVDGPILEAHLSIID